MKKCPECAESVQEDARKCRFCGFRFAEPEDAPATSTSPASRDSVTGEAARTKSTPSWPFLIVASGGALVAAGGIAMCFLLLTGTASPFITVGAFGLGGLLLAAGWGFLVPGGNAGIGAVLGGVALTGCWIFGASLDAGGGQAEQLAKGLLGTAGLLFCAMLHLNTLEKQLLDGARLAALFACIGFGGQLFAFSKKIKMPGWAESGLMWSGVLGIVLFGAAILIGAYSRWSELRKE